MTTLPKRAVYEARTHFKLLEMDLARVIERAEFIEHRWGDVGNVIVRTRRQAQANHLEVQSKLDSFEAPMDGRFDYERVVDRDS